MSGLGKIYTVATPIGNLGDITLRALEILKSADFILCEDTRQTRKLLNYYNIQTPTISYHQHSDARKVKEIKEILSAGKSVALVTDAGTPGISDPGNKLINYFIQYPRLPALPVGRRGDEAAGNGSNRRGNADSVAIVPIPGASAATAVLSASGFPADKFLFLGFPPVKKKRQTFFKKIAESEITVVFFESGHRILKTLEELKENLPEKTADGMIKKNRPVAVGRELTKRFETFYRGTAAEVIEKIKKDPIKGEYAIVVGC